MNPEKISIIVVGVLVFAAIGFSIFRTLFNPELRKQRERHAQQLNEFQQLACRSLEEAWAKKGRSLRFTAVTQKDGEVQYHAVAMDGLALPPECTPKEPTIHPSGYMKEA